jgi:hypothetical protein
MEIRSSMRDRRSHDRSHVHIGHDTRKRNQGLLHATIVRNAYCRLDARRRQTMGCLLEHALASMAIARSGRTMHPAPLADT